MSLAGIDLAARFNDDENLYAVKQAALPTIVRRMRLTFRADGLYEIAFVPVSASGPFPGPFAALVEPD